jgi:hypothetical protein
MSLTGVYGSDAEDDAAEIISADKSFKADVTGRAKAGRSRKDKRGTVGWTSVWYLICNLQCL